MAPQYQPDFELVNTLKDVNLQNMQTGKFVSADPSIDKVTIRGSSLVSPYNNSYSEYLKNALSEELKQSALWDTNANIVISGELLENEMDASGFSIGEADLSARFLVSRDGTEVYNKVHTIHHEWASSFVGAVAIPNAINNYPIAVQKLIGALLLDIDLLNVTRVADTGSQ
ncbi:MAG: hypothetical protein OEU91_03275 [Gammaproteobacteria bacterium]|nr:hypothetical protein [Gammaproteobacteria bacterium]